MNSISSLVRLPTVSKLGWPNIKAYSAAIFRLVNIPSPEDLKDLKEFIEFYQMPLKIFANITSFYQYGWKKFFSVKKSENIPQEFNGRESAEWPWMFKYSQRCFLCQVKISQGNYFCFCFLWNKILLFFTSINYKYYNYITYYNNYII